MQSNEFRDIMEALREIAVDQAALNEKVESHLRTSYKVAEEVETTSKMVQKHDSFMKVSLWVIGFILSGLGIKFFTGNQ